MTLDSARGSDGCEASPRLPTGLCGSRIRTDDSFYVLWAAAWLLDDRLATDGHGGTSARLGVEFPLPGRGVLPARGGQQVQAAHLAQRVACGDKPYDKPNGQDMYRFDPAAMADALCYLLRNRWFGPGRVAQTLSDCASISALSGYRVVQVIAALLPDLDGIRGANGMVEALVAHAGDYGMSVPEELCPKMKGSSVMAKALRALDALPDAPTGLAREAWLPSALSSLVEPMEATPPAGDQPLVVR